MPAKTKNRDEELEEMIGGAAPTEFPSAEDDLPDDSDEVEIDLSLADCPKAGIYHARVQHSVKTISSNGNPQINLKFYLPELSRSLDTQFSLTSQALGVTAQRLRSLGVQPQPGETIGRFRPSDLVDRLCRITTRNESWEGVERPKVASVLPPNEQTEAMFADV